MGLWAMAPATGLCGWPRSQGALWVGGARTGQVRDPWKGLPSALTALFQLSELGVWLWLRSKALDWRPAEHHQRRRGGGGARQQRAGTKQKPSIASGWLVGVCCKKYTESATG